MSRMAASSNSSRTDAKTRLRAAARALMTERESMEFSLADIAARSGLNSALVKYHFGSKDGLWKAVALDLFAELEASWAREIPEDSAMPALERVKTEYRNFLRFTIEHPAFHHFMVQENIPSSPRLEWLVENVLSRLFQRILPQIKEAQGEGRMIPGDPILVYYALVGIVTALSSLSGEMRILAGIEATDSAIVDRYWQIVEHAIFQ